MKHLVLVMILFSATLLFSDDFVIKYTKWDDITCKSCNIMVACDKNKSTLDAVVFFGCCNNLA